jgi:hypothetical protein
MAAPMAENKPYAANNRETPMLKQLTPLPLLLMSALAWAQAKAPATSEEPPLEPNMTAVWGFFVVVVICVGIGVWVMWKNSKKRPEEVEGDKF